jgi:hypothetical protein
MDVVGLIEAWAAAGGSLSGLAAVLPRGLVLGITAIFGAAFARHAWRVAAPLRWPRTRGRVVRAGAVDTGSVPGTPRYHPVVEYAYEVHGVEYRGWFAQGGATAANAARHPPGASLSVRYDPRRPAHAATGPLLDSGGGLVGPAVVVAVFAWLAFVVDPPGAWLLVPFSAAFAYGGIRSFREAPACFAARWAATPVPAERSVGPAPASTVELSAPPAVRAALARERSTARLIAVGLTVLGALFVGLPTWGIAPWVGRALHDPASVDLLGVAFGSLVTLVLVTGGVVMVWFGWHLVVAAARDARESVYLETTGPVYLSREVDDEGDSSWWLTVRDLRFEISRTLHDRLVPDLPYGRTAVVAHTKRTDRLVGVRQAPGDGGAPLTAFPVRVAVYGITPIATTD